MSEKHKKIPPPWEALVLVSQYLDPQTLAIASCVSKSWSQILSLDLIWHPICSTHFPSLSNILKASYPSPVPYRRLYAIGSAAFKLRNKPPPKPRLSIHNLIFAVELSTLGGDPIFSTASKIVNVHENQVFKFDIDVNSHGRNFYGIDESFEEINITWNVVLEGCDSWEAVFTMMECKGKLSCGAPAAAAEGWWFSEELPCTGCCSGEVGSGIVADLKVGIGADMKVSVGILRVVDWRYVSLDDGLRYLQHFLLPCECDHM